MDAIFWIGGCGMGLMPFVFAGFVVLAVALIVMSAAQAKKRRQELQQFAQRHGLSFDSGKTRGIDTTYPNFDCFDRGRNRYAENVLRGAWRGRGLLAFDYHYETTSRDSKGNTDTDHHYFSAAILTSGLPLRRLDIRPESVFDKLGAFFGFDDIDFESAEFSRRFHVKSPDRKWAYDVLHSRAIEHLLARPAHAIAFDRDYVLVWRNDRFSAAEFAQAADLGCDLLDMLPNYVVDELRRGA